MTAARGKTIFLGVRESARFNKIFLEVGVWDENRKVRSTNLMAM